MPARSSTAAMSGWYRIRCRACRARYSVAKAISTAIAAASMSCRCARFSPWSMRHSDARRPRAPANWCAKLELRRGNRRNAKAQRPEGNVFANHAAMQSNRHNLDRATVDDFGREWQRFDQSGISNAEVRRRFGEYFALFPWDSLPRDAVGFDAGCGSGRWAALVAPRVGRLHCVDASAAALSIAQKSLAGLGNVEFHAAPLDAMPLPDDSMDFGYSLGVLHHLPDPAAGLAVCVRKLKRGAPMLV